MIIINYSLTWQFLNQSFQKLASYKYLPIIWSNQGASCHQNSILAKVALYSQLMPRITWAKKSPSKSTYIGPKLHIVATWGTIKFFNINTPFEGPVVLRLKYPPIWADWADHANYYHFSQRSCQIFLFDSVLCSVATICTFGPI